MKLHLLIGTSPFGSTPNFPQITGLCRVAFQALITLQNNLRGYLPNAGALPSTVGLNRPPHNTPRIAMLSLICLALPGASDSAQSGEAAQADSPPTQEAVLSEISTTPCSKLADRLSIDSLHPFPDLYLRCLEEFFSPVLNTKRYQLLIKFFCEKNRRTKPSNVLEVLDCLWDMGVLDDNPDLSLEALRSSLSPENTLICAHLNKVVLVLGWDRAKELVDVELRQCQGAGVSLNLSWLKELRTLPDWIREVPNLQKLNLSDLSLQELPPWISELRDLRTLILEGCHELASLPEEIGELQSLEALDLSGCTGLTELPKGIGRLQNLKVLKIVNCDSLTELTEEVGRLENLEELTIFGCKFHALPESLGELQRLKVLKIVNCACLTELSEGIGRLENLEELCLYKCSGLKEFPKMNQRRLRKVDFGHLDKLKELDWIQHNPDLRQLKLSGCSSLEKVNLSGCTDLEEFDASHCMSLRDVFAPESPNSLKILNLLGCGAVNSFYWGRNLSSLEELYLSGSRKNQMPPEWIRNQSNLKKLTMSGFYFSTPPDWLRELNKLEVLSLSKSQRLEKIPIWLLELEELRKLILTSCWYLQLSEEVGGLEKQVEIWLTHNPSKPIPEQLRNHPSLKIKMERL